MTIAHVRDGMRCDVCGRPEAPEFGITCDHSPEEHAKAAVAAIMAKHGPALRAAFLLAQEQP